MNYFLRPLLKGKNLFFIALVLISLQLNAQLSSNSQSARHRLSSHLAGNSTSNWPAAFNLSSFTPQAVYNNSDRLNAINGHSVNPDYGKIAPRVNPGWYELYDKRTATSRSFITEDGAIANSFYYSPVNYLDKNGNYIAINPALAPAKNGWTASRQEFPTYLNKDGSTEITLNDHDRLKFNLNNSIGNAAMTMQTYTVGDNGMMIYNAFTDVDKRIVFKQNRIETDYLLHKPIANLKGDLVITEEIVLPDGYSLKEKNLDALFGGTNHSEIVVTDASGKEYAHFKMPVCYDSNKGKRNQSICFGQYIVRSSGGKNYLDVVIPSSWLNDASRMYPVVIDPSVTGPVAVYAGPDIPSCDYPSFSTATINVTIPAGVTITNFNVLGSFYADVFTDTWIADGALYFSTPCGSTDTVFGSSQAGSDQPGTFWAFGDIAGTSTCCYSPSCSAQTIPLSLHLTRGNDGEGCIDAFIFYDLGDESPEEPFEADVVGRTVELKGGTSSNWSVSPTSLCSNVCTLTLNAPVANGVPPYTITHAWAASGSTFGSSAANDSCLIISSGTATLTLNIPHCPTSCGADSTITVPAPTIKDACGNSVTMSSKTFTKVPIPVVTPNPTSKTICSGASAGITLTSCATGSTITWTGSNGHSGSGGSINDNPVNGGASAIVITYTVSATSGGCAGTPVTVPVTVNPPPTVTVSPTNASVCPGDSATLTASGGISYTWSPSGGLSSSSGAIVKATPGTYSVTGTDGNGCTATKGVTVTAGSSLTIAVNPTSSTICSGKSVTLIASGATSYAWNPSSELSYISANGDTAITVNSIGSQIIFSINGSTGGCTGSTYDTVKVGTSPTVGGTASPSSTVCAGSPVTLSGTGAIGYTWTGGVTNGVSFVPSGVNTYTVTGTAANGCTATGTVTVTSNPLPTVGANASPSSTVCAGTHVTLSGTGAGSYSWTGGVTNGVSFVPSGVNTYTVTGTLNGCSATGTITITANALPTVGANATPSSTVCAGSPVTLSGTGASGYSWTGGVTNGVSFVPSGVNTYTVTGTAGNGCTASSTITITANALPTVGANASPSSTVCAGSPVTLSGTGASSYSWTGGVSNGVSFVPSGVNTYTVTGTAGNGCTAAGTITVTSNALPTVGANASPSSTVCAGSPVTLSGTGASSYSWTGGVTNGVSFVPSGVNTYTVTGTAVNGCTSAGTITVTSNALPTVGANASPSSTVCAGSPVTLSGTGASGYSWTGGVSNGVSFVPSGVNTYTVTGTAGNGCTATGTITITANALPTVGATASPSATVCTGSSVTLSGTGASSYSWTSGVTNGVSFIPPSGTDTYTVTGTAGNGCTATGTITLTVNPVPTVGATVSPASTICAGSSVTLSGTGASTYSWTGGVTNGVSFVPPTGTNTYTVTGTISGCGSNTSTVTIIVNSLPAVGASVSPSSIVCAGTSVTLSGTGANSYSWTVGVTNGVPFVPSGIVTYVVTGTASNGCTATAPITIVVNPLPTVGANASPSSTVCAGSSVTLSGTGASSYSWTGGVTNGVSFVPSGINTYTVTGRTGTGCSATGTITVTVNSLPTIGANATPSSTVCAGASVTLSGTGASSYSWTGGVTNGVSFVPPTGTDTYSVTGTDVHGCTNTASSTINVTPSFTLNAGPDVNICPGDSASINVTGAPGGSMYSWSPATDLTCSNCANPIAYPSDSTHYVVTATGGSGCSATTSISVIVAPLSLSASASQTLVCYGSPDTLTASGGTAYLWTPSADLIDSTDASITITALATTTYSVTASKGNCSATKTVLVNVNPELPLPRITQSPTGDTLFCTANPIYTTYQWYHDDTLLVGQTHSYLVVTQSGNYNVVVKDENGCSISAGTNITINGVYNFSSDNSISIFPNPASDELTIRSSSTHGNERVLISVMDVLGKTVQQEQVSWSSETKVNIKNLSAGIYFLQLQEAQDKWIGRFVKE